MRPDGAVVAMVGGRNYAASQFNRAVQAKRQPGSAFKAVRLSRGTRHGLSPNDEVLDAPIKVGNWQPDNYSSHYHGRVTLADAFAYSTERSHRAAVATGRHRSGHCSGARSWPAGAAAQDAEPRLGHFRSYALLDLTSAYAAVRSGAAPVEPCGIIAVSMPN